MRGSKSIILVLLWTQSAFAKFVGNPSEPTFYTNGIALQGKKNYSLRLGYLCDYIYNSAFEDEFKTIDSNSSELILSFFLAHAVFNIKNRVDIYGLVGASRMRIDELVYPNRYPCWGLVTKATLFRLGRFAIGTDFKYFETDQKPSFFVLEGTLAPLLMPLTLKYYEFQEALAISFRIDRCVPYAGATYLFAKVEPDNTMGLLYIPEKDETKKARSEQSDRAGKIKWRRPTLPYSCV